MFVLLQNDFFKCVASTANVMMEPSHKSELHTQLMYGDPVEYLGERVKAWVKIHLVLDKTSGWVLSSQLESCDLEMWAKMDKNITLNRDCKLIHDGAELIVDKGSIITNDTQLQGHFLPLNSFKFDEKNVKEILLPFVNAPYMWGGVTQSGIDCSGLSKVLYRYFNIYLPSIAAIQIEHGVVVDFIQNVQIGDLAFFDDEDCNIHHVGIMLNSAEIIHSSESNGGVQIDGIDHEGIVSKNQKKDPPFENYKTIDLSFVFK